MPEKKTKKPRGSGARRRRKPAGRATGLVATELQDAACPKEVSELQQQVEDDGGKVLGCYREPYGGRWIILAALPIEQVEATPYQRDISDTNVRKLEGVNGKLGRVLAAITVVEATHTQSY